MSPDVVMYVIFPGRCETYQVSETYLAVGGIQMNTDGGEDSPMNDPNDAASARTCAARCPLALLKRTP